MKIEQRTFVVSLTETQQKFEEMRAFVSNGVVVHSTTKRRTISTFYMVGAHAAKEEVKTASNAFPPLPSLPAGPVLAAEPLGAALGHRRRFLRLGRRERERERERERRREEEKKREIESTHPSHPTRTDSSERGKTCLIFPLPSVGFY